MLSSLYTLHQLKQEIQSNPTHWRPLVFTNGCFDLIHVGHVRYLQTARSLGRALVVGLNSDRSIAAIKPVGIGPPRPIIPEEQRAEVLGALKSVEGVVLFNERDASHLIEVLQPELYVKGGDYQIETLPEAEIVQSYGGRVEIIPIEVCSSTSNIIRKILQKDS
jgi:D-glycero-beta-D-manno-heptose 1-phosphate adenylyltransferase